MQLKVSNLRHQLNNKGIAMVFCYKPLCRSVTDLNFSSYVCVEKILNNKRGDNVR